MGTPVLAEEAVGDASPATQARTAAVEELLGLGPAHKITASLLGTLERMGGIVSDELHDAVSCRGNQVDSGGCVHPALKCAARCELKHVSVGAASSASSTSTIGSRMLISSMLILSLQGLMLPHGIPAPS
ncbi:hypothetical protein [Bradyrhizobium sp. SSUT77]|uniref:hypothetical protein n=1 Tax=Bradyrhizobium sp. SSUT77 TaxID=3040603 RepID=UPI002447A168|nr:hypothetical protein [Bradyrhizobium sp. SSUT77]MDH2347130.1 hypothetical protein [Bradyrhizobium sp. SSUT77]